MKSSKEEQNEKQESTGEEIAPFGVNSPRTVVMLEISLGGIL